MLPPNVYDAEPIPVAARAEIERLLSSGDLFRYTAPANAPVTLLEQDFAKDNKLSVAKVLEQHGLTVSSFVRLRVGA